jgi:hypothetical protein
MLSNTLPVDILILIFEEYILMNGSISTLLRVSKDWRRAVICMPTLWHRIHLCVDNIPYLWRQGSVPFPSTVKGLQTILKRTGATRPFKVVLVLGDARLPEPIPAPSSDAPPMLLSTPPSESANEAPLHTDRRARLFGGLRYLDTPDGRKPTCRIRSLRIQINPPMNHDLVKQSLEDLFHHTTPPHMMPILERLKVSVAPLHEIDELSAALSSSLHALNANSPSLRTLCLERTPMSLLTRILSPFPFYGPFANGMARRLTRIHIKNTFEGLDISTFALAERLEDLSFSGIMTYNPGVPAQVRVRDNPLPGTDPIPEEILNDMWRTLYPNHRISPGFTPPNNVDFVCIPNLRQLHVGTISMPTLRRLQLPVLKDLTILNIDEVEDDIPRHSLVFGELKNLVIGTYVRDVDAIVAPKLEQFKLGIPDILGGINDRENDWCTRGCSMQDDGTFIRNCDGASRASHINILHPPLLNCVFDGDGAMLRPRSLEISGPVHDYVLIAALRKLPELSSLTLSYRVAIGDKFWRFMTPRTDQPTDSTGPTSTQGAEAFLCPKLKSLTLDLCTKSPNTPESNFLRRCLWEMIDARNRYAGIAPLEQVTVQWEAPAESWDVLAMGSPQ